MHESDLQICLRFGAPFDFSGGIQVDIKVKTNSLAIVFT
jgi:hypothetical protein